MPSDAWLESWGLPKNRTDWIGDPALYFATEERRDALQPFQGRLAVNLGITYGKLYGFNEEGLEQTVIRILNELVRIGWSITPVCAWEPDDVVVEGINAKAPVSGIEHWHDDFERALKVDGEF